MTNQNPDFIIFTGPMFSTKTTSLLVALERYKHQHKRIVVFKPAIDDRYSIKDVVSHSGARMQAQTVVTGPDILRYLSELDDQPHVVAVDEAFMIPGISEVLVYLFRLGVSIVVSTLDMSAACKPFDELAKMTPWATQVHKLTAVCTVCGADAYYTHKKVTNEAEIEIGANDLYEPRCWTHFPTINKRAR